MREEKIALLGLGNVGRAFADYLARTKDQYPIRFRIGAVADTSGGVIHSDEARIQDIIACKVAGQRVRVATAGERVEQVGDFIHRLPAAGITALVESLPTNLTDGQPALDYLQAALAQGTHVVTVDKGSLAHGFEALSEAARLGGARFAHAGTTGVCPPEALHHERVVEIKGILNGTTNYILTEMQTRGVSFDAALAAAQAAGIAEPDPTLDIDGWDTVVKTLILAKSLMGATTTLAEVSRIGIGQQTDALIETARARGQIVRLLGRARIWQGRVRVSVAPKIIDSSSPFYSVTGTSKAAVFRTQNRGDLLVHATSGRDAISQTILEDLLRVSA